MSLRFPFLSLLFLLTLITPAGATQVIFNDLNMVDRDISIYQVNATATTLIYQGASSNTTYDLDPLSSYQIVLEPSRNTWFDDPRNFLTYLVNDGIGQTITLIVGVICFGGLVRLAFR